MQQCLTLLVDRGLGMVLPTPISPGQGENTHQVHYGVLSEGLLTPSCSAMPMRLCVCRHSCPQTRSFSSKDLMYFWKFYCGDRKW